MHMDSASARDHAAERAARPAAAARAAAEAARAETGVPRLIVQAEGLAFRPLRTTSTVATTTTVDRALRHWPTVAQHVLAGRPPDGRHDPTRLRLVTA